MSEPSRDLRSTSGSTSPGGVSIRSYLTLMVLAVTVPLTLLGAYFVWSETRLTREIADTRVMDAARGTAEAIGQFLRDSEHTLEGLARRPTIRALDPESCLGFATEANQVLLQYTNVFVVRRDGEVVCSAIPPPPGRESAADASWYAQARDSEGFHASTPQFGRISEVDISVFSMPIRDDAGEVTGFVAVSVDLARFREILDPAARLTARAVATLAHVDGTVIARSDGSAAVGRMLPRTEGGSEHAARTAGVSRTEDLDGVERVWGYRTVPGVDWIVYAGIPTAVAYSDWRREAIATALGVLLLVALLSLLAGRLYRKISGSLARLLEGVEEAAAGEATSIPTDGPKELVTLARAFNRTLAARTRAEASLRRSTERYQSILNHAVFGIYVSTPEGRFLEANPALARMLGYETVEELMEVPMHRFYRNPEERRRLVDRALDGRGGSVVDVEWTRRDGSPLHARLYVSRGTDLDGRTAFEVIVEDLTERRELEEQLRQSQRLEALGTLAGGVAHDFNNRLTVIQGQAGMLLIDLPDEDPLLEHVEAILQSAQNASELTAQLLAFGRKQVNRPRLVDLNAVVQGMERFLPRMMPEDIEIVVDLTPGAVPIVADSRQIEQLMLNLCTNARDAMPDGGHVTIVTEVHEGGRGPSLPPSIQAGPWAVLTVTDDGMGMDEHVRSRLFEPFFTTKPEGRGTGLGLSTVYGTAKQMGGTVEVVSAPGKGATFHVWLPLADGDPGELESHSSRTPPEAAKGLRVLVAEDEDDVRRVLVRALGRAGYDVTAAADGSEAVTLVAEMSEPPDLLITDIVMPGLRGGELADSLSALHPGLRVLFISGYSEEPPTQLLRDSPNREFLAKPFTPDELLHAVAELVRRARAPT